MEPRLGRSKMAEKRQNKKTGKKITTIYTNDLSSLILQKLLERQRTELLGVFNVETMCKQLNLSPTVLQGFNKDSLGR